VDLEQQLPRRGLRVGQGDELERLLLACEDRRAHPLIMLHALCRSGSGLVASAVHHADLTYVIRLENWGFLG